MYLTTTQKKAIFCVVTLVMMQSGRITPNKGAYWRKVGSFLNISDKDKSEASSMKLDECTRIIASELNDEQIAVAMAMVITMTFADGQVSENVWNYTLQIVSAVGFGAVLERLGQARFEAIEKQYAL